jgi:hypothetical protein
MKPTNLALIALAITLTISSCKSCQKEKLSIEFVDLSPDEIDTLRFDFYDTKFEKNDSNLNMLGLSKGATWRTWRKLHTACMKNEWFKQPFYFGVSNTANLGIIVNQDYDLKRTMDATSGFTDEDIKRVINYGTFASCNFMQELTMSLTTFIQSDFNFENASDPTLSAELNFAIAHNNSTKVKIDSWRVNNLIQGNISDVLSEKTNSNTLKKAYLEALNIQGWKILTRVIEVKGFTSEITLETDMSVGLQAKLEAGVIANLGNSGIQAEFKFKNKRMIEVKSGGNFYVFGQFNKAKSISSD